MLLSLFSLIDNIDYFVDYIRVFNISGDWFSFDDNVIVFFEWFCILDVLVVNVNDRVLNWLGYFKLIKSEKGLFLFDMVYEVFWEILMLECYEY